jgi:hypothetical protein
MREGYYSSAFKIIQNALETYHDDSILKFYLSINLLIQSIKNTRLYKQSLGNESIKIARLFD